MSAELRDEAAYHLATMQDTKGVRPGLVKAAAEISNSRLNERALCDRAAAVQLLHEAMLIMDDVLDESPDRRGRRSLYFQYGRVIATAVAAEISTSAMELIDRDRKARALCRLLLRQVCIAETIQERERSGLRPFSLDKWKFIAIGDTGAIFDLALGLGEIDPERCPPAKPLAYLRHGLDDIDDLLDSRGDQADVRDHIPTLLTCFTRATSHRGLKKTIPQGLQFLRTQLDEAFKQVGTQQWRPLHPFVNDFEATWCELKRASESRRIIQ